MRELVDGRDITSYESCMHAVMQSEELIRESDLFQ